MEEKLSTIYLVSGQTALQYLMNVSKKYRQIATEAVQVLNDFAKV